MRRLLGRRSARSEERVFVVEGQTLVDEALSAGAPVEAVYVAAGAHVSLAGGASAGVRVHELAPGVLERVADTVTPQPVLAVVGMVDTSLDAVVTGARTGPVVVCADVRDPGNLGTVVRSAEAAGAAAVLCCDGTVDVYNPKCVRASAGAVFHVPIVVGGALVPTLGALQAGGRRALGTATDAGDAYTAVDLTAPVALVLGNEAVGLPASVGDHLDGYVHIPMEGRAESLNVGMACAVLCFEAARQRRAAAVGS